MRNRNGIKGVDSEKLSRKARRGGFPGRVWVPIGQDENGKTRWASKEASREDLARRLASRKHEEGKQ